MNDNGAITGMDAREDGVYITYVPADGADPVSKKLGSNGITYLGDMPYTCTQDYGDCTLLTFCHQKTATQNVTIKNLNGSYNIKTDRACAYWWHIVFFSNCGCNKLE